MGMGRNSRAPRRRTVQGTRPRWPIALAALAVGASAHAQSDFPPEPRSPRPQGSGLSAPGSQGESGLSFVAYPFFRCRVGLTPGGDLTFRKTTGSQRTSGNFYPDTARRLVYLGAQDWGSEGPKRYGDDHDRDQIGVLERIGPNRYRLALPFPRQESVLDLIEIVK